MTLLAQTDVNPSTQDAWQREALADLAARLSPPSDFPCTFSQNAFRRELLLFSFIDTAGADGLARAAGDLRRYVEDCRRWDGRIDSARPLLVIFSVNAARFDTPAEYHAFGWHVLQYWHDHDPAPWPGDVSARPTAPFWSFCFAGMQLFVNMSAPAHRRRRSRNLGRYFTLVINPRERFDIVADSSPGGTAVRRRIRTRVAAYDGQPHAPQLGSYNAGQLEWVQYALPEDNGVAPETCPFRFRGRQGAAQAAGAAVDNHWLAPRQPHNSPTPGVSSVAPRFGVTMSCAKRFHRGATRPRLRCMDPQDLTLTPRGIRFLGRHFPCSIGRGGVRADKHEGDGATPRGTHRIAGCLYRPDRLPRPAPWAVPIRPGDLWSDDPARPDYNTLVRAPYGGSHERLCRPDPLYDIVLLTDWNWPQATPDRGSAIFLHQWRKPHHPTEGCIALARNHLALIAAFAPPGTRLRVP